MTLLFGRKDTKSISVQARLARLSSAHGFKVETSVLGRHALPPLSSRQSQALVAVPPCPAPGENPARVPGQRPATVSEQFGERGRCVFGADARSRRSWARLVWMPLKTPVGSSVAAGAPAPEFGGLKNLMATRLSKRLSRRRCLECATSPTGHLRVACVAAPAWLGHRAGCGSAGGSDD